MVQADALDFVFGGAVTGKEWDEADHEERLRLVEAHVGLGTPDEPVDDSRFALLLRLAVVEQIITSTPPETWTTAQRLSATGMDRAKVLGQITIVLVHALRATLGDAGLAGDVSPLGSDAVGPGDGGASRDARTVGDGGDRSDAGDASKGGGRSDAGDASDVGDRGDAARHSDADGGVGGGDARVVGVASDLGRGSEGGPTDKAAATREGTAGDTGAPAGDETAEPASGPAAAGLAEVGSSADAESTARVVSVAASSDVRYLSWLTELPLPESQAAADALQEVAAAEPVLPTDELVALAVEHLGYTRTTQPVVRYVERIEEHLAGLTDAGPLAWMPGSRTVHVAALTDGITLTHVLTDDERRTGALGVGFDLAGFARVDAPVHDGQPLVLEGGPATPAPPFPLDRAGREVPGGVGQITWVGPDGWLDRFEPGTVLAVTLAGDPTGRSPQHTDADTAPSDRPSTDADAELSEPPSADADPGAEPSEPPSADADPTPSDRSPVDVDTAASTRVPDGAVVAGDAEVVRRRVVRVEAVAHSPAVDDRLVAAVRRAYDQAVEEPGLPVMGEGLVLGVLANDPTAFAEAQAPLSDLCAAAGLELRGRAVAHEPAVWAQARTVLYMNEVIDRADDRATSRAAIEVLTVAAQAAEGVPVDLALRRNALNHLRSEDVLGLVTDQAFDVGASADEANRFAAELLDAAHGAPQVSTARYVAALAAERAGELDVAEQQLELAVEVDNHNLTAVDRLAWYASDRGDAPRAVQLWRQCEAAGEVVVDMRTVEPFAQPVGGDDLGRNDPCWCGSGRKHKHCHLGVVPTPPLPDRVPWLCQKAVDYVRRSHAGRQDVISVALALTESGDDVRQTLGDPLTMDLALTEGGWFSRFLRARGELLPDDEAVLAAEWLTVPRAVYEVLAVEAGRGVTLKDVRTGDEVEVGEPGFARSARVGSHWCCRPVSDGETHKLAGALFLLSASDEEEELLATLAGGDPHEIAECRAVWVAMAREEAAEEAEWREEAGPPPTDEDMLRLREQLEERWCDEPHPGLDGLTPREAASDPAQAERLEQLLAAVDDEGHPPPMDFLDKRSTRLRELLGL